MDFESFANMFGHLLIVAAVIFRHDEFPNTGTTRGDHLFTDAAHREDLSGQGQLTGHGYIADRFVPRQGEQCRGHGNAGGGAVFGGGSRRHMEMDEGLFEERLFRTELCRMADDVTVGDLGRLAHHIAQLAGELEAAIEFMSGDGLDIERSAAHGGPGQAGDHPCTAQIALILENGATQVILQIVQFYLDRLLSSLEDAYYRLANDLSDLLLQSAHTLR